MVATHPIQFLTRKTSRATGAHLRRRGRDAHQPKRIKRFSREQYFKTRAQMAGAVRRHPSALANSVEIAGRCNLDKLLGKPQLPNFPTPEVDGALMPMADYFGQLSHEGLEGGWRISTPTPHSATRSGRATCSGSTSRSRPS